GQEPYRPAQVVRGAHGGDGVRGVVHGERLPAVGGRAVQAAQVHADGGVHLGRGRAEHRGRDQRAAGRRPRRVDPADHRRVGARFGPGGVEEQGGAGGGRRGGRGGHHGRRVEGRQ